MKSIADAFLKVRDAIAQAFGSEIRSDEEEVKRLRLKTSKMGRIAYITSITLLMSVVFIGVYFVLEKEERERDDMPGFAYTDSVINSAVEIERKLRGEQNDQN